MEFLKFKKISYKDLLRVGEASSPEMRVLGEFLEQDVSFLFKKYLDWLDSPVIITGGNTSCVFKSKGNIVIENKLTEKSITLTKKQFVEILEQWKSAYESKPQEFIIKKIGDKFIFDIIE